MGKPKLNRRLAKRKIGMRFPFCYSVLQVAIWASIFQLGSMIYLDPENDLNEDEFLSVFGLPDIKDEKTKAERSEALKKHEELIQRQNDQFAEGKKTWWDELNSFADLPDDEIIKEKNGWKVQDQRRSRRRHYGHRRSKRRYFARGVIPLNSTDDRSEKFFDTFRYGRGLAPSSYNAVEEGLVSPVKHIESCATAAAFATMAAIETCFKKITGVFGDYSEQELIDCAYDGGHGKYKAGGCDGSRIDSYARWIVDNKRELMHENDYPYLSNHPKLECPRSIPYRQGARVIDSYVTRDGDEELLKVLVYEYGAVVVGIREPQAACYYKGGIFDGCISTSKCGINQAVTVVGYGTTEYGQDYWLIKNSWGDEWGDRGFIKIKRGENACGIGHVIMSISCESVPGPTSPPQDTCHDLMMSGSSAFCRKMAKTNCKGFGKHCKKSCGLCPGDTPHDSNSCADMYPSCAKYTEDQCNEVFWSKGKPTTKKEINCCISCKKYD